MREEFQQVEKMEGGSCQENTGNDFVGNLTHFEHIADDRISKAVMDF